MDPDEVTLVGLGEIAPQHVRDRLGNLIRGNVVPPDPGFAVRWARIDGRLVAVLDVEQSAGRPYGLRFQDKPVEFYVRRGASTYPATQEEIRALAAVTNAPTTNWPPRGFRRI